jgi:3D-(3,5/4)-trihydroxycyclohexane-1,2-dione acylhydrolase (decyclizing)
MAHPDREIYALVGDGTFLMNNTELVTAVQEGIKITIVVSVNHGFQSIRRLQMGRAGIPFGNEFRRREGVSGQLLGEYLDIDFAKNAESLGAVGLNASSLESLQSALDEALRVRARPVVIAVDVHPDRYAPDSEVWWDIAVAEVSGRSETIALREEYEREQAKQRFYY